MTSLTEDYLPRKGVQIALAELTQTTRKPSLGGPVVCELKYPGGLTRRPASSGYEAIVSSNSETYGLVVSDMV